MKVRITNLRDNPYSTDVENSQGEMIRVLIPPAPAFAEVADIDPFYLNQDKNLRNAVFRDLDLAVAFVPEPDDLIALPSGSGSLTWKEPARLATTANIVLSGLQVIDGLLTAAGDRILVKNQADARENGIYSAAFGMWTRTLDANATGELDAGTFVIVTEGVTQVDTAWYVSTNNPVIVGTTPITWAQFFSGITAGQHQVLRQLIHFIDEGPASGFATGAFKEVIGGLFPTQIIWWESAAKAQKIVEKIIDRTTPPATNLYPTSVTWRVYAPGPGVGTVVGEVVDTITYSGAAEVSRTRAIVI